MFAAASLDAHKHLKGEMTFCSLGAGWQSLLLRSYIDPPNVDELVTSVTPDHKIVLVTAGSCNIESRRNGSWVRAAYRAGHIGMVAPEEQAHLSWRSHECHATLQVHLPAAIMKEAAEELFPDGSARPGSRSSLSQHDLAISSTVLALERAARAGAPDLYAEVAARFLAIHVTAQHGLVLRPSKRQARGALEAADDFMRANLHKPLTLAQLAAAARLSRFQLLREAKIAWGETPILRLTRLRMETAQRLLLHSALPIIDIALECGYGNPAHFATAFKRHVGIAPSELRR